MATAAEVLSNISEVLTRVLWGGASSTGVDGKSAILDLKGFSKLSIIGNAGGSTTLTLQGSHDGSTWFDINEFLTTSSGDFHTFKDLGVRYVRVNSASDVTVEAYGQAKF